MRFFNLGQPGQPDDPNAAQRKQESLRSLASGGLPLNAVERLREQATTIANAHRGFSSTLSINEQLLLRGIGVQVLGQVMGSSIYQIGFQYLPSWSGNSMELTALSEAYYAARHLALNRMQQEAALLGAHGVVGMQIVHRALENSVLEFLAFGTAIKEPIRTYHQPGNLPFVSDLSGHDYYTLHQAGFRPVGFAFGCCVFCQVATWRTQMASSPFGTGSMNQELTDFTQSLYQARERAMERMVHEALAVQATGVIGSDIEVHHDFIAGDQYRNPAVIHYFTALGTAIAPYPAPDITPQIDLQLMMTDTAQQLRGG